MQALVMVVMVPLMLLNLFGGVASGIWLAILGEWWAVWYGLLGVFLSHFVLGVVLMPSLLFAAPAGLLLEKERPILAFPFVLLSNAYICIVMTAWCVFIIALFMSQARSETFWPLLIWSYGVALGPWMYMAQKEQAGAGDASAMTTFFAQVAYVVMAALVIFGKPTIGGLAIVFGSIMAVAMLIQTGVGFAVLREQRRLGMIWY